jgi:beta-lactamase regulating signal transducer with metallopeptidase domain
MNPLLHWLNAPEWTQLVAALLHSLWQGALLAILLAVLLRRLTQPRLRYYASLGTLGILVLASIITWAVLTAPETNAPVAPAPLATESAAAPTFAPTLNLDSPDKVIAFGTPISPAPPTVPWTAWLAMVWMLGTFAMLLRAGIKVAGAEKLRRSCQPLTDETMTLLVVEACRAINLARKIRVAVTDQLTSPAVVGILVPTLILPLSLFTTLTPEQIRFILLHELAHIRRGDYLANLFQLLAEALLFFNPAVWWLSHHIRREREACCDALAIQLSGAPADYAKTLVRVAENTLAPAPSTALAFGEDGREPSSLADRVQRLLVPGYRPALRLTWRAMLTSLFVGGTLLFLSAVGTRNTVGAILSPEKSSLESQQSSQSTLSTAASTSDVAIPSEASNTNLLTESAFDQLIESIEKRDGMHITNSAPLNISTGRVAKIATSLIERNVVGAVSSSAEDEASRPITNVLGSVRTDLENHSFTPPKWERSWEPKSRELKSGDFTARAWVPTSEEVLAVLEQIKFDRIFFRNRKLSEVLPELEKALLATDPAKFGFRLLLPPDWAYPPKRNGIESVVINMPFELRNATMRDVLEAIVSSASSPIQYQLGGISANFMMKFDAPPNMWFRQFNVYGKTFLPFIGVDESMAAAELKDRNAESPDPFGEAIRKRFLQAGVDLRPPNSVLYKPAADLLYVHAQKEDLDAVEELLKNLSQESGEAHQKSPSQASGDSKSSMPQLPLLKPTIQAIGQVSSALPRDLEISSVPAIGMPSSALNDYLAQDGFLFHPPVIGMADRGLVTNGHLLKRFSYHRVGRVGEVQLSERTFNVDPVKLQDAVRKAAAAPASVNRTNFASALRNYFLQAGINFDPNTGRSFYLNDRRGQMLIRATGTELDAIGKLLEPMRGGEPLERRTYHVDSNQLAQVVARLPAALRQIMATNPAAGLQAILESFNSEDPRPKQVRAFSARNEFTARATAEDFSQFETLFGISALPPDRLLTREYKLPVEFVNQRILINTAPARLTGNTASNQLGLVHQALRDWFTNAAVDLNPNQGKGIVFNDRAGIVLTRATTEELDKIESAIQELMWQPPQVNLKIRWVETAEPLEVFRLNTNAHNIFVGAGKISNLSGTLTRTQANPFFERLKTDPKFRLVNEGQVTTTTDRQAQIQVTDVKTVVTGIDPRALQPPGIHDDNSTNASYILSQAVPLGPVIDLLPSVEPDGWNIKIRALATVTEFAGYASGPEVPIYVNGQESRTTLPLPKYLTRQLTNDFVLRDSETFYFGNRHTVESVKQPDGTFRTNDITAQQTNYLVVFITAMIIDPTGIPANRDLGLPSKLILPSRP